MPEYTVLVVDDHPLMRQALCTVIDDEPDLTVVGEAANGDDALSLAVRLHPDVIIMDLLMPVKDGIQAIDEITKAAPEIKILALSSSSEEGKILSAVQAGAMGYLTKDAQPPEILAAVRATARGEHYLEREMMFKFLQNSHSPIAAQMPNPSPVPVDTLPGRSELTQREQEILNLVAEGLSNRAIAQRLYLSEATVRSHIYHLLNKLGLEDRSQAIVYALKKQASSFSQQND